MLLASATSFNFDDDNELIKSNRSFRPANGSTAAINPLLDYKYKKHDRNELINVIDQLDADNRTLKRQLESNFIFK